MTLSTTPELLSPAIVEFVGTTKNDPDAALTMLREALTNAGGPLIEAAADGGWLTTFVYIGPAEHSVAVDSHAVMSAEDGVRTAMQRVAGTDVWFQTIKTDHEDLCVSYKFLVDSRTALFNVDEMEAMTRTAGGSNEFIADRHLAVRDDPFNADRMIMDGREIFANDPEIAALVDDPEDLVRWENVLTLPAGGVDPALLGAARARVPDLEQHVLQSAVWGDERQVTVHAPAGDVGEPRSVLFMLDGPGAVALGLPGLMEELVARGQIRPTVTVYVHNKNVWSRSEEMICHPKLVEQYADELLPWVRDRYQVSGRAEDVTVGGGSYGGLGSSWLAYNRPDLFGNVLSMSGSYWWGMKDAWGVEPESGLYGFDDEPEWLTRQFAQAPHERTRFFLAVGSLEGQFLPGGITLLSANRHLRTVLRATGYNVTYHEYHGGHDRAGWRSALLKGLQTLHSRR